MLPALVFGKAFLACRQPPACRVLTWPSVPAHSVISSSSFKNRAFGLGPQSFATSFHLNYFFKGPISKYSNIGSEDFNLWIWGEQNSVHYSCKWRRKWQPTPVLLPGKSPWTEETGGLQSMESKRVGHDWATKHTHTHTHTHTQTAVKVNITLEREVRPRLSRKLLRQYSISCVSWLDTHKQWYSHMWLALLGDSGQISWHPSPFLSTFLLKNVWEWCCRDNLDSAWIYLKETQFLIGKKYQNNIYRHLFRNFVRNMMCSYHLAPGPWSC